MSQSIAGAFEQIAAARPEQIAISSLNQNMTYQEFERLSAGAAALLHSRNLAPGRSIALIASGIDYIVAYFGIVRAGYRAIPIEARFRGEQLHRIIDSTKVAIAIVDASGEEALSSLGEQIPRLSVATFTSAAPPKHALPAVAGDSELCVLFSSGSTGMPKGVILTHEAGLGRAALMGRVYGLGKTHLVFTPLAYAYGLIDGVLCPLLSGGRIILLGPYNPFRFKEVLNKFDPDIILGVPFLYKHLASMATDLLADSSARTKCLFYTTGEPLPQSVRQAFHARYSTWIRQNYGLSEVSAIAADLYDADPQPGKVGKVIPGVEIRIVTERLAGEFTDASLGEVWIKRSQRFMKGYVSGTETIEGKMEQGYYRTGDIGSIDDHGFLELFGRNDDFVMVAGVRIHPAEIENVLLSITGVLEAAFVCDRNQETGEQSTRAYVVFDPTRTPPISLLESTLRAELPPSRWPGSIEISAGLPRTDTGKLVRRLLVERKNERLVASAPVSVQAGDRNISGNLLDVSRDGCMVLLKGPLAVGETLILSLHSHFEIGLSAQCRSVTMDALGHCRAGLEFFDPDPIVVERLINLRHQIA